LVGYKAIKKSLAFMTRIRGFDEDVNRFFLGRVERDNVNNVRMINALRLSFPGDA